MTVYDCDRDVLEFIEYAQTESVSDLLDTVDHFQEQMHEVIGIPSNIIEGQHEGY